MKFIYKPLQALPAGEGLGGADYIIQMKIKITPLNFATAFFLFLFVYTWIYGAAITGAKYPHLSGAISLIFLLFAFVVSFMDIMFRNFFPETKKLWLIELSFITLATIIFLIVK